MSTSPSAAYVVPEALERHLGDPFASGTPLCFDQILADDEAEAFPERACADLAAWGLCDYFVPREFGGRLGSFEEALALLRVVARRDLSCAIALGQTYLGAVHVWIGGDAAQRAHVARHIRTGGQLAFALTEREHGSDILANDLEAVALDGGGYRVTGEKWLINNGTRARLLTVFARTGAPGPRGYSLLCIDVGGLAADCYERLPKIHTHGIRGADISGIRFRAAFVPASARVGALGVGLELALKGLMITRTMCAGFALGAADTALRGALRFACSRQLYGVPVFALADARHQLTAAFADLIAADALAVAACRALHVSPQEISVRSAIAKYVVPTLAEEIVRAAGGVLGARNFIRGVLPWSVHQKLARDVAVVGLFDGNAAVNLTAILAQLPTLMREHRAARDDARDERLRRIFDGNEPLEPFDPLRLALANRGRDDVVDALPIVVDELERVAVKATDEPSYAFAAGVARRLAEAGRELAVEVAGLTTQVARTSAAAFDCARRYCYIHAGAVLVHYLLRAAADRAGIGAGVQASPPTLAFALARVAARAGIALGRIPPTIIDRAGDNLLDFEREAVLFSLFGFRIAQAGVAAARSVQAVGS